MEHDPESAQTRISSRIQDHELFIVFNYDIRSWEGHIPLKLVSISRLKHSRVFQTPGRLRLNSKQHVAGNSTRISAPPSLNLQASIKLEETP